MRGCKKKVIFLKHTGSEMFDSAYFILSDAADNIYLDERDMIAEATRIIDESRAKKRPPDSCEEDKRRAWLRSMWFTAGTVTGAGLSAAILTLFNA